MTRLEELEALNAEYAERCASLAADLEHEKKHRSRFGEYQQRLDAICSVKGHGRTAQCFRRDPALPGTSEMAWACWLETEPAQKAYGRTGMGALLGLVERLGG